MKDNFERCLAETLSYEGGWSNHPADPGGATMKGITIGTFRQWKGRKTTISELRAISDADVRTIYKRNYWNKVRGDDLPYGLDMVVFDGAVNSGPARSARWLQTALGVEPDGKIGSMTISAAQALDRQTIIERTLDLRLSFLQHLKTWPTFGDDWSRRIASVRAAALDMAALRQPPPAQASLAPKTPVPVATSAIVGAGGLAAIIVAIWVALEAWIKGVW